MKNIAAIAFAFVLLATGVVAWAGQKSPHPKLTRQQAQKIALQRVNGGKVTSAELENEKGALVWSFDIAKNEKNITEILVNANTGAIIDIQKESAAHEAVESRQEKEQKRGEAHEKGETHEHGEAGEGA